MPHKVLKNKPLVEALVEIRWALESPAPNVHVDPHYKIALGRLFDRVKSKFPEHEQLPAAMMPDEFAGHVIQHRFRRAADDWPLIQLGPGIFSFNETAAYDWDDFRSRASWAVQALFASYPDSEALNITSLLLRYVDAKPFNYSQEDVLAFLDSKMGVKISLPVNLFESTGIQPIPQNFTTQASFGCSNPSGTVTIGFATGMSNSQRAIVWETMVRSLDEQIPSMPNDFEAWLEAAHAITHDWFFKLIAGDLEKEFAG